MHELTRVAKFVPPSLADSVELAIAAHMLRQRLVKALALSFLVACARDGENVDSSENAILPNGGIFELGHDGATYQRIAATFAARGVDMHVNLTGFEPAWPLDDQKTTVLNRQGTPLLYSSFGYIHTGLDIVKSDATVSSDVLAPHDGLALVFDWSGNPISTVTNPYATIVAIYDPISHVVTELQHVAATAALAQATAPVEVKKGSVLGTLAPAPLANAADAARLANTQVVFVDAENQKLLDPAKLFGAYGDTVAPDVKGVYLSDDAGVVSGELSSGKLDLLVEVFDHDDASGRNFEVSALAFTVKDQNGKVLSESTKCNIDSLFESTAGVGTFRARELVDFGTAFNAGQASGAWPNSDVDNPYRTFRYALTSLASVDGRCTIQDDATSFLEVGDDVTKLDVSVTVWDVKGNETTKPLSLERPVAPPVDADAGTDADGGFEP